MKKLVGPRSTLRFGSTSGHHCLWLVLPQGKASRHCQHSYMSKAICLALVSEVSNEWPSSRLASSALPFTVYFVNILPGVKCMRFIYYKKHRHVTNGRHVSNWPRVRKWHRRVPNRCRVRKQCRITNGCCIPRTCRLQTRSHGQIAQAVCQAPVGCETDATSCLVVIGQYYM